MSQSHIPASGEGNTTNKVGFLYRHRKAIVTTVVTLSTAVSAYYVYKQLKDNHVDTSTPLGKQQQQQQQQEKDTTTTTTPVPPPTQQHNKKKKKNKNKNKQKEKENNETIPTPISPTEEYPTLPNGEPDINVITSLPLEQQEKFTLLLKDKGNNQFKLKNFETALDFYHWALQIKIDPIFYSNISACYVSLNQLDKVVEYCNKALELKPDYSKVLLRRASAYEQQGKYQDAMFDLSVLSLNNDFNGASIEPILERNLNKQAMLKLNELQSETDSTELGLPSDTSLASFFNMLTPPELTFDHFDSNLEADVILQDSLTALYNFTHQGFKFASENFLKTIIMYKDYLKTHESDLSPEDQTKINHKLAIALEYNGILQFMKGDMNMAQDNLKESITLVPRVKANIFLAMILADKWATTMVQNSSTPTTSTTSSPSQESLDKLKQQYLTKFDDAISLDPQNSIIYYHRGQISFIAQDFTQARADFTKSIELNPENVFPYIQLACLSYRENNFTDCERQFNDARAKFPLSPEIPTFYAELLTDKMDLDDALKQYDIAIKLEDAISAKENGKIHVGVAPLIGKATIMARRQPITPDDFQASLDLFQTAVDKDPRNEQALIGLAQLKLQQEDVDTSIELFEKAAQLARSNEEKLQAITFAEAAKVQKKIRADPIVSQRVEEALAQYRAQGLI